MKKIFVTAKAGGTNRLVSFEDITVIAKSRHKDGEFAIYIKGDEGAFYITKETYLKLKKHIEII